MTTMTKIACLCPTYKRPELLQNAAGCFLEQMYPEDSCRLYIYDDAGEHIENPQYPTIKIRSTEERVSFEQGLPYKYNQLMKWAEEDWEPDWFAIWEDDDIFLRTHLSNIHESAKRGQKWFRTKEIFSNYGTKKDGTLNRERATGRFHSSWAFQRGLVSYPETDRLDFDQQLGACLAEATKGGGGEELDLEPTYVYRWGNSTYHGSALGDNGYREVWRRAGLLPKRDRALLEPKLDEETARVLFPRAIS